MLFMVIESFRDNDMVPVYQSCGKVAGRCQRDSNMSTTGSRPTFPATSN
jgi:hypothetical protein